MSRCRRHPWSILPGLRTGVTTPRRSARWHRKLRLRPGAAGIVHFKACTKACLVWLAWQEREPRKLAELADGTAELLRSAAGGFAPWKWIYLWPVVAMHLSEGKVAEAVAAGLQMLEPLQHQFPDSWSLLESAVVAWTVALMWPGEIWPGHSRWRTTSISFDLPFQARHRWRRSSLASSSSPPVTKVGVAGG